MGDVYRAHDTILGRDVAIKILPEAFNDDPARLARFTQEAQFLASLSHPNIAAIYGVHESDGIRGLVLELVDGETLAERIRRGPIPCTTHCEYCGRSATASTPRTNVASCIVI
jgi:serine/threonine-protein kinase